MADDARRLSVEQGLDKDRREHDRLRAERLRNYRTVEGFIGPLAKEFAAEAKRLNHPPNWGLERGQVPHWQVPIWVDPDHDTAEYGPRTVPVCIGKRGKWWFHKYNTGESFPGGPALTPEAVRQRMIEYLAQVVR